MYHSESEAFVARLARIRAESLRFLAEQAAGGEKSRERALRCIAPEDANVERAPDEPLAPCFALHRNAEHRDLYGVLDALLILHCCRRLVPCIPKDASLAWAEYILSCQEKDGWFTRDCHRGHPREHSTAYALAGLSLLAELAPDAGFLDRVRPIAALRPLLANKTATEHWLARLGLYGPRDIPRKNLGWHYVWRSSHIAGGVAASVGMLGHRVADWFPEVGSDGISNWFNWYFNWLDAEANPKTGLWQRAFWNRILRRPTVIDLGGAAHFLWIYEHAGRAYPHADACIRSVAQLQRSSGLYKQHPFCIDFDGVQALLFCAGLSKSEQSREMAHQAAERNALGIVHHLADRDFTSVYTDSHGLPGALCALGHWLRSTQSAFRAGAGLFDDPFQVCWWI